MMCFASGTGSQPTPEMLEFVFTCSTTLCVSFASTESREPSVRSSTRDMRKKRIYRNIFNRFAPLGIPRGRGNSYELCAEPRVGMFIKEEDNLQASILDASPAQYS